MKWWVRRSRGTKRGGAVMAAATSDMGRSIGVWVAVKDGAVIATADTSGDMVRLLETLGSSAVGAIAHFKPGNPVAT